MTEQESTRDSANRPTLFENDDEGNPTILSFQLEEKKQVIRGKLGKDSCKSARDSSHRLYRPDLTANRNRDTGSEDKFEVEDESMVSHDSHEV